MMEREDFIAKMHELVPAPDDAATQIWINWAGEIAEMYDKHLDDCEYIRGSAPESSYNFFDNRTEVQANLQELYAVFYNVNQKYGGEIVQHLYMQSLKRYCMYPHEFLPAAEYLSRGGAIGELGQRMVDGEFDDIDSQTNELRSAPAETRETPLFS